MQRWGRVTSVNDRRPTILLSVLLVSGCIEDANPLLDGEDAGPDAVATSDGVAPDRPLPEGPHPRIEFVPPSLLFVAEGTETLRVNNVGDADLDVRALRLDGDARAFTLLRDGRNALAGAIGRIEPGSGVEIEVSWRDSGERDEADLVVDSDDPRRPSVRVPLTGGVGGRCFAATPGTLELGQIRVAAPVDAELVLRNCGEVDVTVTGVAFAPDVLGFSVATPPLPFEVAAGEETTVMVTVRLEAPGGVSAALRIETDGEPLEVQVLALGVENACPQARVTQELYVVDPGAGEVVTLDASPSIDPDGEIARYEWLVVEQPEGGHAVLLERVEGVDCEGLPDDPATPRAHLCPRVAGRYVLELRVTDVEGCTGSPARVVVDATGGRSGLRLELVWDAEVDLDLHLLHPDGGAWFLAPFDCYFQNAAPDWGQLGDPGDDPEVLTDSNAFGPEIIRLGRPEGEGAYIVGVHAFGGDAFPTEATVRTLINGVVAREDRRVMEASDHFWEPVQVAWPEVVVRDRYTPGRP